MNEVGNPFEPPKAEWVRPKRDESDVEEFDDFVDATRGTRLANSLIDSVFQSVIILLVTPESAWSFVVSFAYYIFFEAYYGKTPGKWITKTRVVTRRGRRPRLMQIVGRTFARWVPFDFLSFLGRRGEGWHDRWSGTRVVVDRAARRGRRRRRRR